MATGQVLVNLVNAPRQHAALKNHQPAQQLYVADSHHQPMGGYWTPKTRILSLFYDLSLRPLS